MELRHLRYFIAIAEAESFRRAAEQLRVSQSPLSRQMQQLEEEMGVALFEPAGRGVRLTSAGRLFLEKAKTILSNLDAAVAEAKEVAGGRVGTVRIGFEGGSGFFGTLSTVIARLRKQEPRINVELVPMNSAEQWEALRLGEIAVGYGRYLPGSPSFQSVEFQRQRVGIIMSKDHRLASKRSLRVKDLAGERVYMDPRDANPRLYDDVIAAVRARGVVLDIVGVRDGEAMLTFVASGFGVSFGDENVAPFLTLGHAIWKPVSDLDIDMRDIAMWRPEDAQSPLLRPVIDLVREVRGELREFRVKATKATKKRRA